MYESFFGLNEKPFNMTPDPEYLFFTSQHQEAFAHLVYGIRERRGFIQITGEVGAGKTTLCRAILNEFDQNTRIALILNPMLSDVELLRAINDELFIETEGDSKKQLLDALNAYLIEQHSAGKNVVLLIDEAQNLCEETLEQIRIISNLETVKAKLIQIVLVGQPELREKLDKPEMRQLNQRITVRYHLTSLAQKETENYIAHRLKVAGSQDKIAFTKGALKEIYRFSQGVPRKINVICDHVLLTAFVKETHEIDKNIVKKAWLEIEGPGTRSRRHAMPRWLVPTGATVVIGLILASTALFLIRNKAWWFGKDDSLTPKRYASAGPDVGTEETEQPGQDLPVVHPTPTPKTPDDSATEASEEETSTPEEVVDHSADTESEETSVATESGKDSVISPDDQDESEVAETEAEPTPSAETDQSEVADVESEPSDETDQPEVADVDVEPAPSDENEGSVVAVTEEDTVPSEGADQPGTSDTGETAEAPETKEPVTVAMVPDRLPPPTVKPPVLDIEEGPEVPEEGTEGIAPTAAPPESAPEAPRTPTPEPAAPEAKVEAEPPAEEEATGSLWDAMMGDLPSVEVEVDSLDEPATTGEPGLADIQLEIAELPSPGAETSEETYGDGEFDAYGVLHTGSPERNTIASLLTLAFRWEPEEFPVYQAYRSILEGDVTLEEALGEMGLGLWQLNVDLDRMCHMNLPAAIEMEETGTRSTITAVVLRADPAKLIVSIPSNGRKEYSRRELEAVWPGRAWVCVPAGETQRETIAKSAQGPAVKVLETRLAQLGFFDPVADEEFDSDSAKAVKAFQDKYGLEANGSADPETQILLYALTSESGLPSLNSQLALGSRR